MLRYVDHVILGVADLDAAARDYAALLGFTVTAGGAHPGMGTRNRLIVLDPEYVELLGRVPAVAPSTSSPLTPMLARLPGAIGFALASDDLDADIAAIRARGFGVGAPTEGRLERADGSGRGWRMARIVDDTRLGTEAWRLPFLIQHDSTSRERLERLAQPDALGPHPVRARSLGHVTVAVHDLAVGIRDYAGVFGLTAQDESTDGMLRARTVRLPLAHGAIVLAMPLPGDGPLARGLADQGEGLYSITIAVDDLPGAVNRLRGRRVGVRVQESDNILVAARPDLASTHSVRLELVRR